MFGVGFFMEFNFLLDNSDNFFLMFFSGIFLLET